MTATAGVSICHKEDEDCTPDQRKGEIEPKERSTLCIDCLSRQFNIVTFPENDDSVNCIFWYSDI